MSWCGFPHYGDIVKRGEHPGRRLPRFMAFSGHDQNIAGTQGGKSPGDSLAPITRVYGAGAASEHRPTNRRRVFRPRIVVSDPGDIGEASGGGAHQRPFARIAIAAGTEQYMQASAARDVRTERL